MFMSRNSAKTLFLSERDFLLMMPQSIDTSSFGRTLFSDVLGVHERARLSRSV